MIYARKIGDTLQTPINGFRLRAVTSRDVRAPNLSELFAAPVTTTVPNFTNPRPTAANPNGQQMLIIQNTIGNAALRPETARSMDLGARFCPTAGAIQPLASSNRWRHPELVSGSTAPQAPNGSGLRPGGS